MLANVIFVRVFALKMALCSNKACNSCKTFLHITPPRRFTMATKNEILAQLYAIKAGLSIISQEKDKIAGAEKKLNKIQQEIDSRKSQIAKCDQELTNVKEAINLSQNIPLTISASKRTVDIKKGPYIWGGIAFGFFAFLIIAFIIVADRIEDYNIGSLIIWLAAIVGAIIGAFVFGAMHKKDVANEQAKAEQEWQDEVAKARNQHKQRNQTLIENANKSIATITAKRTSLQQELDTLTEKFNTQYAIYSEQKDLSLGLAKTVYDALIAEYATVLDPRDWKNIDFIIFYYETGRVDTLKEALIHVDKQRQTDTIAKAIKQASQEISSTINTSMTMLRGDLNSCFGALSTQLDKSMQIQLQALEQSNVALGALSGSVGELGSKLQTSLNALGNEQALTNALLDKVATSSDALVNDLNYVMGYKAPYYLKK